jgi:hypothetical protein
MKRVLAAAFVVLTTACYAQQSPAAMATGAPEYQAALGVKISAGAAVSYKKFVANTKAIEAQSMFFSRGIRLIGLYEFHFYNIQGVDGLAWYAGPGIHAGFYRKSADLGIDGVIGLDYKIKNTPINLSLDWQPSYSLFGDAGLLPQFGGLAIRYVLQ